MLPVWPQPCSQHVTIIQQIVAVYRVLVSGWLTLCLVLFRQPCAGSGTLCNLIRSSISALYALFIVCLASPLTYLLPFCSLIRPHRPYYVRIDAVCCYRPSSVVCPSVCHTSEPCENGWTDRGAVWVVDLAGPMESCVRWGLRSPYGKGQFWGKGSAWRSGNVVGRINEVALRRARLVLGWVTVFGG